MLAILIICLVIFGAISLPIGIAMGLATMLCLVFATNIDPIMVAQNAFAGIDSFSLMAIPFFMLAGNFMRYGGISKRLLDLADNIVGFFTGGLGAITTFTAMFYAAISGSGPATVSAIGSFMIPEMEEKGYDKGYATALSAAAGTIGVIIPPSIPFVIYGVATGTSIGTMFTAFPILYPSGLLLGADPVFLAGAILSGAIFGDNVGPISDTTIASASTQEYTNKPGVADVAGVVGSRMKYALVAAAAATVCFALFGGSGSAINAAEAEAILTQYSNPKGLIMLIPVAILLIVAFIKRNIYVACTWGLISGTIIGLVSGILVPSDIMGMQDGTLGGFLIDGVNNMIGTVGYLYAIAGIIGILSASGLLQQVIDGRGYVPEAKKAAKQLLYRRRYGE